MPAVQFNRNSMAKWYAKQHRKTDPGIVSIHFLLKDAGDQEIRLIEVNNLIGDRTDDALEPIDFGIDTGTDSAHKLFVLDVTPAQWERIKRKTLPLPSGWSLDKAIPY